MDTIGESSNSGNSNRWNRSEQRRHHVDSEVCFLPMDVQDGGTDVSQQAKGPLRLEELAPETQRRLEELTTTRKGLEDAFPPPKKCTDSDDLNFLTKTPGKDDLVTTKPQQEEAAFIIRHFRDPPCRQFRPPIDTKTKRTDHCSVCGLTEEFHGTYGDEKDSGGRNQETNHSIASCLMERLTQVTRQPLIAAAAASATCDEEEDMNDDDIDTGIRRKQRLITMFQDSKKNYPALTFGSVQIPMRFVGHPSSTTKEKYMRKYMKYDADDAGSIATIRSLWDLLTNTWQMNKPIVVFSVTGGTIPTECLKPMKEVAVALKKITSRTDCWILSDGRNSGSSKYLGKILQAEGQQQDSPVFLCATHWGSLHRKELFLGISLPRESKSSQYFYSMEYKLSQEDSDRVLNPYQAVYLFLDNGHTAAGDCVLRFRRKFEEYIKETVARELFILEDVMLPVVTLVIGGDDQTLTQILYAVEHKNPVILVNKSGPIPSLLAELFYTLEDAHPRTWNETPGWTEKETTSFEYYLLSNDEKIREIWMNKSETDASKDGGKKTKVDEVKKMIKKIMENRYYVTVVDSSFEKNDHIYSNILQGIYKGYSRRNGMAIALKTGSYDFLQALFHRDVDPQFTKEQYTSVRSLNSYYQEILTSESSISKVLKLMCKRDSIVTKVDADVSVLPFVGRIFHLLLGSRYKIMYQEERYSDIVVDSTFDQKRQQIWHLFLWTILCAKPDMTRFFLIHTPAPLGASLLAFKLYSKLACYSTKVYEEELTSTLKVAAETFQKTAIDILDKMYNIDMDDAYRVLISELPYDLGPYVTPLVIANDAEAMEFVSHACCQTYLQKVWKGKMAVETPFWKSLFMLAPFAVVPWIHFDGSPLKQLNIKERKTSSRQPPFLKKLKSYYSAPITKFYARMFSYVCFLGVLSYFVLTDLKPCSTISDIKPSEWIVMFWELALITEEIVQIATLPDGGPLYKLPDVILNSEIWHRYEKFRMNFYVFELYIRGGHWNTVDVVIVSLFILSSSLRFALPLETFQMARVVYAILVIVCYFRLLRYWYVMDKIGPRIIAIQMMLAELTRFLVILAVFVISFGIAFQAILNPNQDPSWTTFFDILWRPYWEMFGELFLDDEAGMGRPVGNESCSAMADAAADLGIKIHCYDWAAPALLGIYLLISSVLLLNLLIAIFSITYEKIDADSHTVWLFNLYSIIQEFHYQSWLPPPFSFFLYVYKSIRIIIQRFKRPNQRYQDGLNARPEEEQDGEPEDCFRLSPLPSSHELQKKVIKEIKISPKEN